MYVEGHDEGVGRTGNQPFAHLHRQSYARAKTGSGPPSPPGKKYTYVPSNAASQAYITGSLVSSHATLNFLRLRLWSEFPEMVGADGHCCIHGLKGGKAT